MSERDEIDLGDGHRMIFCDYEGQKRVAAHIQHQRRDGAYCVGFIPFKGRAWSNEFNGKIEEWDVVQDDPVTLSPSILCRACGDHGFVRNGKWVRA